MVMDERQEELRVVRMQVAGAIAIDSVRQTLAAAGTSRVAHQASLGYDGSAGAETACGPDQA
jgi:hypothetical protein